MKKFKKRLYKIYIKRKLDIVFSFFALVLLSPMLLIVAILVKLKLGSPILFKQERPGIDGEIFIMYKFRTMTDEIDESGNLLPDYKRLTKFGKLLRSTSLDELPELINIIKGDMSIIGPRPLLVQYLPLYNTHQKRRHEVRPGLTGLAQAHGRNELSWEDKFTLDVEYVDNISFTNDLKILFLTLKKILKREGINQVGGVTMEDFKGTGVREKSS